MGGHRSTGEAALVASLLVLLAVAIVYPLIQVLSVAVVADGAPTLRPLLAFVARPLFREALVNTLLAGLLAVVIGSVIAVPLALLTVRYRFPGHGLISVLGVLPLVIPPFVGAVAFQQILGRSGAVNLFLLDRWGVTVPFMEGFTGVVLVQSLHYFPFILLNTAAALGGLDLLSRASQRRILESLREDDPRVAKLALSPYFRIRAEEGTGPLLERLRPELDRYLASEDPIVRYSAWDAVRELFAVAEQESPAGQSETQPSLPPVGDQDWASLEALLERERSEIASDPVFAEVRQAMIAIASLHPERPSLQTLLRASCDDPSYVVRRDAVQAMREANLEPPREAEPVETGRTVEDYLTILEWARRDWRAEIETAAGTLSVRLFTRDAPLTCWNFSRLCEESFYDGGNWHRVVPDFVLQDGCPRGDGWGGPPWQIRCEINRHRYERGALGMALSGKDTGGSQFFLTHSDQPHLDGGYTVFGALSGGQSIADQIVQGAPIHRIRVVEG